MNQLQDWVCRRLVTQATVYRKAVVSGHPLREVLLSLFVLWLLGAACGKWENGKAWCLRKTGLQRELK